MTPGVAATAPPAALHPLERLLWPRAVAIVGAAPTGKHRTRGQLVRYLVGVGYGGRILPVNPSYADVDGLPCVPTVAAIGEPADVAVLALPAPLIPDQLAQCAAAKIPHAVVLSAGFVEAGEEGAALQLRLQAIARDTGLRFCGPNCQGFYNVPGRVTTTFSPTVAPAARPDYVAVSRRRVGIIAQSGGIGYSLYARGRAAGLEFSYVVSSGNEADLTSTDFLDYMVRDPRTDVIVLFTEAVRDPDRFVGVLAEAERRGKPVIALKVGRSAAARRAAASHTAALTGWDTAYRAVFDRYNVIEADHPDEAVAIAGVFATCPLPRGRRAGVITVSGGGGALMADMLAANGLAVPVLAESLQDTLRRYVPAHGATENPVDLTLNSAELVVPTLEHFEKAADIDVIVMVTQLASGEILPLDPARVRALMDRRIKPVVSWTYTLPSEAGRKVAAESGLFLHLDLRNCGRALGKFVDYADARAPFGPVPVETVADTASGATPAMTEHATRRVLAAYGWPLAPEALASSPEDAAAAAETLGFPVALKIQSRDIAHKTDAGGVRLGLTDRAAVARAHAEIVATVGRHAPQARIDGVLVQRMAPQGLEFVVGMVNDAAFGPVMMVGLGGIAIEVFRDVVHRPAPVTATEAQAMFGRLRCARLLCGYRGMAPADLASIAEFVALVSRIAIEHRSRIAEIEFNPVIVHADGSGITVADALLRLFDDADTTAIAPVPGVGDRQAAR